MNCPWLVAALLLPASSAFAAGIPDFSGVWKVDTLQSPLGGSGYKEFTIRQAGATVDVGYADETLTYQISAESTYLETNLGDIPGFARKVTTRAEWDGAKLILSTMRFNETTDSQTGAVQIHKAGMFTRVISLTLSPGGQEMTVESTGFREIPPDMLHGRPYDQKADPIYKRFVEIFRKAE